MALDEPKDTDYRLDKDTLTFLVDNDLISNCGTIKIDFIDSGMRSGFSVTSANPIAGSGGSCGSCGSSCG